MMDKEKLTDLTNEELWQLFPIILSEHKDYWKDNYIAEEKKLIDVISKDNIIRINHIGSTSIPDLIAKPTIDILLEIRQNIDIDKLIKIIESADYIYSSQPNNPPPYMMFMKGYTLRGFEGQAFHLHIRYAGDWDELYFRDYLFVHPDIATKYGELKQNLKEQFEHDRDTYTLAKTEFIKKYTKLAKQEFPNKYVTNTEI